MAAELAKQLSVPQSPAPTLLGWLHTAKAGIAAQDLQDTGATVLESWWLRHTGFTPPEGAPLGSGLAALATTADGSADPVWVADLVHIQVGRDGLVLTDPADLAVTAQESDQLLASIRDLFETDGFGVRLSTPRQWRVTLPDGVTPYAATTSAVVGKSLDSWWPKGLAARPWRRLANEIQMSWHEHPVNEARTARGAAAINGLWLHGGAPAWTPTWQHGSPRHIVGNPAWLQGLAERAKVAWSGASMPASQLKPGAIVTLDELDAPQQSQNWGDWLLALKKLDETWFAPLDQALAKGTFSHIDLVLPDAQRVVTLRIARRSPMLRWLPQRRQKWNTWWLHPES